MTTATLEYNSLEALEKALKTGEISIDTFIAQNKVLTETALKKQLENSLAKPNSLFDWVDQEFNIKGDIRLLPDMCALLVKYLESSTGYKARPESIEDLFPDLTVTEVLSGFAGLKRPKTTTYPVKKSGKSRHLLNGVEYKTNEYILQYLMGLEAELPRVGDDEF